MSMRNIKTFIENVKKKISKQNDITNFSMVKEYIAEIESLVSILTSEEIEKCYIPKEIFDINSSDLNTIKDKLHSILCALINLNSKSLGLINNINKGVLKLTNVNKKLYNDEFILKLLNNEFKHLKTLLNKRLESNYFPLSALDYTALKNLPHNLKEFKRKDSILRDMLIKYSDLGIYKNLIPNISIEELTDNELLLIVYKLAEEISTDKNRINIKEILLNLINFSNDLSEYNRLFSKTNNLRDLLDYIYINYECNPDITINPNLELLLDELFKNNINKEHKDFFRINKYFLCKINTVNKSHCLTNLYMYLLENYPNENRINFIKISAFLSSIKLTIGYFKGMRISKVDVDKETFNKVFYNMLIGLIDLTQNN